MGAVVTSMTWNISTIDIVQNPEGVNNERRKKATYVVPGLGQAAALTHPRGSLHRTTAQDRT